MDYIVKSLLILLILLVFICPLAFAQTRSQPVPGKGLELYEQNCLSCHQADGSGVPMLTPPLVNAEYVKGDKIKLINIVLKGLKGVEIGGTTYNTAMPAFKHLSDEDIAAVLTYVRNNFNNNGGPIMKEDVAAVRKVSN